MRNPKVEKGITLIALIITIIVLLIISVVAIGSVQESKIIVHAQNARERYQIEKIEEKIKLTEAEMKLAEHGKEITVTDIIKKYEGEGKEIEPVSIASNAKSVPENMPAGNYYILEPEKYAANNNENIRRYAKITSRGEEREENILKDVYVINEQLDIYYIIEANLSVVSEEDKDANEDIVITSEKDLTLAMYQYNTMYNPKQPEIVSVKGYYDDNENNDRMCDKNPFLGAYIYWTYFDIEKDFFGQAISKPGDITGDIKAKITHFDGTVEEIRLATTDNKAWRYEIEGSSLEGIDNTYIGFRPFAKHKSDSKKEYMDEYEDTLDYHYMYIEGEVAVPFYKLEILGKTLEFPYNCQAMIGNMNIETEEVEPIYNNIEDVSKIIINFSDGSNKVYTQEKIFDISPYIGRNGPCSSQEIPVLYGDGMFLINMPEASLKTSITSIVIEENGIAVKYNVSDSTMVMHMRPGS